MAPLKDAEDAPQETGEDDEVDDLAGNAMSKGNAGYTGSAKHGGKYSGGKGGKDGKSRQNSGFLVFLP